MFKEKNRQTEIICSERIKYNQQILTRTKWTYKMKK